MSKFLTALELECVTDLAASGRGVWQVATPFAYESDILGKTITVEPGFLTDLASVPRIPVAFLLFGDTDSKAAVLHDWLYHHHEVCDEATANQVLLEASVVDGVPMWRRLGIYLGVRYGGKSSWEMDGHGDGHQLINGEIQ